MIDYFSRLKKFCYPCRQKKREKYDTKARWRRYLRTGHYYLNTDKRFRKDGI